MVTREDWDKIEGLFHRLWGLASAGDYQKNVWKDLQALLERARNPLPRVPPKQDPHRELYIVRLWDMFDGWIDISGPLSDAEAQELWRQRTEDGTKNTKYEDGTYYKVFPANTRMFTTSENLSR